ncbi:Putative GTP-binding protein YdgA [plant metagenome]|uniref:GTP-binding protein YdgA n=1 Tax=plant metagenome TaxID=1297885 RepID=A0A484P6P1_9ZZZZ
MKKTTAGLTGLVVLAAAYTGASWYTGKRIEAKLADTVAQLNIQLRQPDLEPLYAQIETVSYSRGLFSSEARYALVRQVPAQEGLPAEPPVRVGFVNKIAHGPLAPAAIARGHFAPGLAHIDTELENDETTAELFALTKGTPFLSGSTRVTFSGGSDTRWALAPIDTEKNGARVEFSGATLNAKMDAELIAIDGTGEMARVAITDVEGQSAVISDLKMAAKTTPGRFKLGVGDSSVTVASMEIKTPETPSVKLESLSMKAVAGEEGDNVFGTVEYGVGKILVQSKDFGSVTTAVRVAGLPGQTAKRLQEEYKSFIELVAKGDDADAAARDAAQQKLLVSANEVLAAKPSFSIDPVLWKTPQGESRFDLKLAMQAPKQPITTAVTPRQLLEAVASLDASVSISQAMATGVAAAVLETQGLDAESAQREAQKQVGTMAGMAAMMQMGVLENGNLVSRMRYADGTIDLNGKQTPIDGYLEMLGPEADQPLSFEPALADGEGELGSLDPERIAGILEQNGYTVETTQDDVGDPLIVVNAGPDGALAGETLVEFYGCESAESCQDMLIKTIFETEPPVPLLALNDWNANNRWTRAYQTPEGETILEMDVNAQGGLGTEALESMLFGFMGLSGEFAELIGATP